jgi:flagellar biosynthesis/type III secretory pathway protein FliH
METNETIEQNQNTSASASTIARYAELQALVAGMASDFEKFYRDGNKAAGTRVRNAMQTLKTFAQSVRTEVQAIKNGGKPDASGESADDSDNQEIQ